MPKVNAIAVLADNLVTDLATSRASSTDYPICLDRLSTRLLPRPDQEALLKAVANKKFTSRAIVAVKGRADAPVALREHLSELAASPLTLEVALRVKGEQGAPPWLPKQLAGAVHKDLKAGFLKAINERVERGDLPAFAVAVSKGKTVVLYHRDRPPPPPPPSPSVQDAERLVDLIRRRCRPGEPAPLITVAALETEAGLTPAAFKKAAKEPTFAEAVTQVKVKPNDVLVTPNGTGDEFGRFVTGPLLTRLLAGCARTSAHAFPTKELVGQLADKGRQQQVASQLNRHDLASELPTGVGCVLLSDGKAGGQNVFFSLEHLRAVRSAASPSAESTPRVTDDFATAFDAAFARIDRERGSNNFVSLVNLRSALPSVSRETFDAGLQQLRRERRYVLTSDERYDGLTPEQQAAAIREEGEFLLHVSRGRP
ncbi:MAG: hypothetical protein K8U57_20895 [Planctomycetes bacterium]|nr:hypothetical protein [Planctomycetota bacterium]